MKFLISILIILFFTFSLSAQQETNFSLEVDLGSAATFQPNRVGLAESINILTDFNLTLIMKPNDAIEALAIITTNPDETFGVGYAKINLTKFSGGDEESFLKAWTRFGLYENSELDGEGEDVYSSKFSNIADNTSFNGELYFNVENISLEYYGAYKLNGDLGGLFARDNYLYQSLKLELLPNIDPFGINFYAISEMTSLTDVATEVDILIGGVQDTDYFANQYYLFGLGLNAYNFNFDSSVRLNGIGDGYHYVYNLGYEDYMNFTFNLEGSTRQTFSTFEFEESASYSLNVVEANGFGLNLRRSRDILNISAKSKTNFPTGDGRDLINLETDMGFEYRRGSIYLNDNLFPGSYYEEVDFIADFIADFHLLPLKNGKILLGVYLDATSAELRGTAEGNFPSILEAVDAGVAITFQDSLEFVAGYYAAVDSYGKSMRNKKNSSSETGLGRLSPDPTADSHAYVSFNLRF